MLNGVNLRIKLNQAKNEFCPVSSAAGANFKVVIITEAILFVRTVKVASSIILGHAAALKHSSAKYPIRRIDCKVLSIPRGFSSFSPDNIFLGHIPKRTPRLTMGVRDCAIITWRGGWETCEIFPKTKSYPPPLIKQKLTSTPLHIMMILRLPPLPPLNKVSSHWFPHT